MPKVIQYVTYLIPLRYFLIIVRYFPGKGNGLMVPVAQRLGNVHHRRGHADVEHDAINHKNLD